MRGRLTTVDGRPLGNLTCRARSRGGGLRRRVFSIHTDKSGRFSTFALDPFGKPAGPFTLTIVDEGEGGIPRRGFLTLEPPRQGEPIDAGDIPMLPFPVLAAGRVVGIDDRPLDDAHLYLSDKIGVNAAPIDFYLRRGKAGQFTVYGDCAESSFFLTVRREGQIEKTLRCSNGARDLLIRLHPVKGK